jgi:HlyD family secretion protein
MTVARTRHALRSARRHALLGASALFLLIGGAGGWAATTRISGAVIAQGVIDVASHVKTVRHVTGGVVAELRVDDGAAVKAGEILIRLDDTLTRANLAIIDKSLDELIARKRRLEAERDGQPQIAFPQSLTSHAQDPDVAHLMNAERQLFQLRRIARDGQKDQLNEQLSQLHEQIQGFLGEAAATKHETELIRRELEGVGKLSKNKLVPISRYLALQREAAHLAGESNKLVASVAEAKGKMSETRLKIIQIDQDLRRDVAKDLRDTQAKLIELRQRKIAAEEQLKRTDIRAPQAGFVHELAVHAAGAVISPGEAIMQIVPEHDGLIVDVQVEPRDIDQIHVGQSASLRFPAFDLRTTPEINGTVAGISPDTIQDKKSDRRYYDVRIGLTSQEVARLGHGQLVPGMPVEAFIEAQPRTVMSFFVKPFRDEIAKAFREN